jgi:predicted HTH transcriptional regulator
LPNSGGDRGFGARRELDIENTLRRSQIETPTFEIKQGFLRLDIARQQDQGVFRRVLETICGIANIGPGSTGAVFVGVADDETDATRIASLDGISPRQVGARWVVGVDREANRLSISPERYYQLWRDAIEKSTLSSPLKPDALSNLDLCIYKGMHILIITIPPQRSVSLFDGKIYCREGDQTVEATPEKIVAISARFQA